MSSNFFVFSQLDVQNFIDFSQEAVQNSRILVKIPWNYFYGKNQHLLDSQINFPEISQRKLSIFQNIVFEKLKKLATS